VGRVRQAVGAALGAGPGRGAGAGPRLAVRARSPVERQRRRGLHRRTAGPGPALAATGPVVTVVALVPLLAPVAVAAVPVGAPVAVGAGLGARPVVVVAAGRPGPVVAVVGPGDLAGTGAVEPVLD